MRAKWERTAAQEGTSPTLERERRLIAAVERGQRLAERIAERQSDESPG
jgi:hypothetical protein